VLCAAALAPHLDNLDLGTPGRCDQIVNREGYALGYSERYEQPLWVAYRLTAAEVTNAAVRRASRFHADGAIATGSAMPQDYAGSGYDRGHLAPAADMRFSPQAMADSFSMANVSPQVPQFNRGVWRVLEDKVRNLALRYDSVVVVTGPVFATNAPPAIIGASGVGVPDGFYKVICCTNFPPWMCAYLLPNAATNAPPEMFAVPTVEVERLTGLDFFSALPAETQTNLKTRAHAPLSQVRDSDKGIYVALLQVKGQMPTLILRDGRSIILGLRYLKSRRSLAIVAKGFKTSNNRDEATGRRTWRLGDKSKKSLKTQGNFV